ncbi:MAG: SAM-dependent chlorinase/fluorinase [Pirellulales bacterium]
MSGPSDAEESSTSGIITLLTDFGLHGSYVAAMKGVILSLNPRAVLVDVTHTIRGQDIRHGAWILEEASPWFPSGTIHVAVVDPGVGGRRKLIYARIGRQHYLAPDNGLLGRLALANRPSKIISLEDPRQWLPKVSATFHGRDILAAVAARLSLGLEPDCLGPRQDELVQLAWPEVRILPGQIEGSVRSIDSFGNLVTDISEQMLRDVPRGESVRITCDEHETLGIFRTYGDQPEMTLMALIGSGGYLELAIVGDSAAGMLGVGPGAAVRVTW